MAWIIGRKSDQSIVEVSNKKPDFALNELQQVIPTNYGGIADDYTYYQLTDDERVRLQSNHDYDIAWNGYTPPVGIGHGGAIISPPEIAVASRAVSGISFDREDAKPFIKATSDKNIIAANGVDSANISFEVWKSDGSEVDTDFTDNIYIPVYNANKVECLCLVDIVEGVSVKEFKTEMSGKWVFFCNSKMDNFRLIGGPCMVDAYANYFNL